MTDARITDTVAIEVTRGGEDGRSERLGFAVETQQGGVESWIAYSTAVHIENPLIGFFPSAALAYRAIVEKERAR